MSILESASTFFGQTSQLGDANIGASSPPAEVVGTPTNPRKRFVDNGDGTVTDTRTNLMWMRFAVGQKWTDMGCSGKPKLFNLDEAIATIGSEFAGYSDWRLPALDELKSIVDPSLANPAFDPDVFLGFESGSPLFWSSASADGGVWYVSFYSGSSFAGMRQARNCVRLVRNYSVADEKPFRATTDKGDYPVVNAAWHGSAFDYLLRDIERSDRPSASLMRALANAPGIVERSVGRLNRTLLHHAAAHSKLEIVKYLCLRHSANINATDKDGDTPLDYALAVNAVAVADYLRSKGAQTRLELSIATEHASSLMDDPALIVPERLRLALQEALTEFAKPRGDLVNFVHRHPHLINAAMFDQGKAMLHLAAPAGKPQLVEWLIGKGGKADALDSRGNSPLMLAMSAGAKEVVSYLQNHLASQTPHAVAETRQSANPTEHSLTTTESEERFIDDSNQKKGEENPMLIEVRVPDLAQLGSKATLVTWHKKEGEAVSRDENLADMETDRFAFDMPAPADGVLVKIIKTDGDTVTSGELIARIDTEAKRIGNAKVTAGEDKPGEPLPATSVPPVAQAPSAWEGSAGPAASKVLDEKGVAAACPLTMDATKSVGAQSDRLDITESDIGIAFDSIEQASMRSGDDAFIVYLSIANKGEKQVRVELPLSSYLTREGEEIEQDVWLSGLINGTQGATIRAGTFRKVGLIYFKSKLKNVSTGDRLYVTVSQTKPPRRFDFSFRCADQRTKVFTLIHAAVEDMQVPADTVSGSSENAEILRRIELLESGLNEALGKLDALQTALLPAACGTACDLEASAQTLPQVLAWLSTQERISVAALRHVLLPLDLLPSAVIDEVNERALDLIGEPALEEHDDEVVVIREILAEVLTNWDGLL